MYKSWGMKQQAKLDEYKEDLNALTNKDEIEMLENIISDLEFEIMNNSNID